MPELPEVEWVRRGLARAVVGSALASSQVLHPRVVRRHIGGADDFVARTTGRTVIGVCRRGKYLWAPLDSGEALVAHLGMSGQLLVTEPAAPDGPHLRVRFGLGVQTGLSNSDSELRFVDQRTFGGLFVEGYAYPVSDAGQIPHSIAHIAPDPFDPSFNPDSVIARIRSRRTGIKRALLDQAVISGIGNIYADEALWRARLHGARATELVRPAVIGDLLGHVRTVMDEAIDAGGTSFDSLYVRVNGQSGYFDRALHVYGREGQPCHRCGAAIRREAFMNRSSFRCPTCQPQPRTPRW